MTCQDAYTPTFTGIALLVSLLYTFMLKVAALPLILSILVLVWGLLAILTAILGFKAGYIDPGECC
jgi:hypothetical protein